MDQILNKVGSYWFSQRANKEINSVGDDINVSSLSPYELNSWFCLNFCYNIDLLEEMLIKLGFLMISV